MIDLSGIARQLHLSVDQIRIAADLLEQGYAPTYIRRYRADETGSLPKSVLWRLKLYIERQKRLQAARERVVKQVPKEVVLDAEALRVLESSRTVVAMESALRSFRARRALEQSQEKDSATGQLLEKMLTYSGPAIDDIASWAGSQIGGDTAAGQQALVQVSRLLGSLIQCDTGLISKLRHAIQRKATIRVEDPPAAPVAQPQAAAGTSTTPEANLEVKSEVAAVTTSDSTDASSSVTTAEGSIAANVDATAAMSTEGPTDSVEHTDAALDAETADHDSHEDFHDGDHADSGDDAHESDDSDDAPAANEGKSTSSKKSNSKMTPRQRRRRWLISMLAPLRSIKKPVNKLTAFQHLMLGRGVRSQLISTPLDYDRGHLIEIARDSFTDAKHPLASWFNESAGKALDGGFRHKLESEALAELEEEASEHLLEHATDELRLQLMRRPVRGHTICLVDTVGPKSVSVVVVDPSGNILASDELPCSVQPEVVNQNVVVLGQLIHKHRVTLVALTNGPVRRFMVATLRELMIQSKDSGLRWTMADRSGAEAYAGGRVGLRELATYNRRERAAVWAARSLQNPLVELLKIDISRMRLGSYQRELPQETLKRLVIDTIVDCVCSRGIDTHHASEAELQYVPGVAIEQAKQIVQLAASGNLTSRAQLKEAITGWPEAGLRQAIGWLRVFDSSTTSLDATLIHPDDYRLAERLVENTELPAPPAAPPGWTKKVAATKPVVAESQTAAPAESETASADSTSSEAEVASGESSEGVVSDESAESLAADTTAEVAEAPVSEEATAEALDPIVGFESPTKANEAAAPATPAIAPEYPEDIVASAPQATTVDAEKLANQWQVGRAKLKSIASALQDPFADPRLNGPAVPLRTDLPTLEDLQPDTCVWAIVVGVADFGAFVELAPNCSGLIHISRLSMNFIEDPHQCVQVGDLLMTWVVNVDTKKNRVALTALSPAQRADVAAANEERRAQIEQERSAQRGGPRGGDRGGDRGPRRDGPPGRPGQARRTDSGPQRTGGSAGGRTGQPAGSAHGGGGHGGGHGGGGHGGGQGGRSGRPERGGGGGRDRDASRGRGGRRGGDEGGRPAKSVVVTSKKPVAPISQAMKQGEEPLRSFSDLMQFYESSRSPKSSESVVDTQTQQPQANDNAQASPMVADTNSDSNDNSNG